MTEKLSPGRDYTLYDCGKESRRATDSIQLLKRPFTDELLTELYQVQIACMRASAYLQHSLACCTIQQLSYAPAVAIVACAAAQQCTH